MASARALSSTLTGIVRAGARAEGKITRQEARGLERRQNRASRDIRRQKHERQVRAN